MEDVATLITRMKRVFEATMLKDKQWRPMAIATGGKVVSIISMEGHWTPEGGLHPFSQAALGVVQACKEQPHEAVSIGVDVWFNKIPVPEGEEGGRALMESDAPTPEGYLLPSDDPFAEEAFQVTIVTLDSVVTNTYPYQRDPFAWKEGEELIDAEMSEARTLDVEIMRAALRESHA